MNEKHSFLSDVMEQAMSRYWLRADADYQGDKLLRLRNLFDLESNEKIERSSITLGDMEEAFTTYAEQEDSERGLAVCALFHAERYDDARYRMDGPLADCLLQIATFGKVIYG